VTLTMVNPGVNTSVICKPVTLPDPVSVTVVVNVTLVLTATGLAGDDVVVMANWPC